MQAQTQQTERQRLEQQLEAARQVHAKARAEYTTAEQDFINTERQIKTESDIGKLATLQTKRDALNTVQPRLRKEVERLEARVSEARNAITQNENFIKDIRAKIASAPAVLDGLHRRKGQAESDVQQVGEQENLFQNINTNTHIKDVKRSFQKARTLAGLANFRFHDLRHTFGSRLAEKGVDAFTIMELMGHSDLRMTERYVHATDPRKREAVAKLENYGDSEKICHNFATKTKKRKAL
jgi:integrase